MDHIGKVSLLITIRFSVAYLSLSYLSIMRYYPDARNYGRVAVVAIIHTLLRLNFNHTRFLPSGSHLTYYTLYQYILLI